MGEAPSAPPAGESAPPAAAGNGAARPTEEEQLVDVAFPEMGDSVAEGTVLEWRKQVGDPVAVDDILVEISTDKVDAELPSPVAGTLSEILVQADETVAVGTTLCRIAAGAGAAPAAPGPVAPAAEPKATAPAAGAPATPPGLATPVAARVASAHGVDVSSVRGSGPRGRVTKEDVLAAVQGNGAPQAPAPPEGATAVPIRGPAATLARFMDESRSIPTATSFRTLPVDLLDARRKDLKAAGKKLSFTHLIAWAIVKAAADWPVMGHSYAEEGGKPQRIVPGSLSLGLAVDVERKDGTRSLVVPVIHAASELDFATFAARYDELVAGARDNKLAPDAYQGANVTLTNPGGLGTVASVPRLMPGQGTIVATGAIGYPPGLTAVEPERLRELGVQKVTTMTSTYDHRVIQGAESGLLPAPDRRAAPGRGRLLRRGVRGGRADRARGGRARARPPSRPTSRCRPPPPPPPAPCRTPGCSRPCRRPPRSSRRTACTATWPPASIRSAREPVGDPALEPESVALTPELMRRIPASVLRVAVPGETFADALPHLLETYAGTMAFEVEHISDHKQRVWLRQAIESGTYRQPLQPEEKRRLLERLSSVEALESYLHKAFLGKKQFSIEGLDALVPMLDETIELASGNGAREVVLGMAHRGRLNVLAHTVGRPYETVLAEFEGEQTLGVETAAPEGGTGDVKYHYGASGTYKTLGGKGVTVTLSPNPSHLEYVNPVIEGRARADQTSRKARELTHDPSSVLPVLIHGDAAFPGQGVVAETLNLQSLPGYSTGGTLHVIANNQLGFTTDPDESRSTRYASDLAKGFDVPIIHVNADDVESSVAAIRLALAYRETFGRDAVVDLIGYRRFGHNETDEPAYTQPLMYERIRSHPPVRKLYADKLAAEGTVSAEDAEAIATSAYQARGRRPRGAQALDRRAPRDRASTSSTGP